MPKHAQRKTVIVGMSGGVDSSVSALLLKKQGYRVIGAFMKNWSDPLPNGEACSWRADRFDARRVAVYLDIPLLTLDFEKEYKALVFENFLYEYKAGRTPNPDILCNTEIKFRAFLNFALQNGADMIATGHYAHVRKRQGKYELHKGKDSNKDQSYFLYTLGQNELQHVLFPIGNLTKTHVRDIARRAHLPTAERKDSQGICFVGNVELRDFLKQYVPTRKGKVISPKGEVVGSHEGQALYTIGQRHGLNVGGGAPLYVSERNARTNTVTVVEGSDHPRLFGTGVAVQDITWVSGTAPRKRTGWKAKIRYRQQDQTIRRVEILPRSLRIFFANKQRAITPGQSIVLYKGSQVLGGGIIDKATPNP
ncbi:MAG: tRNA 2-thiouridine(34) synthase MnmA [Candidatus Kerfeldbacteria bacterium]|nr:tRNA 2-thiouridine(34) synthase MnmA [Candidatus Kerfeldbacteria bacterium]